ncbi:MAG: cytochrome c3 family protein [Chloroflexota bacterium]
MTIRKFITPLVIMAVIVLAILWLSSQPIKATPLDAPEIPHGIAGYEDCVACHNTNNIEATEVPHAGLPASSCTTCHQAAAQTTTTTATTNGADCTICHGDTGLHMILADGATLSLYVAEADFSNSVHGKVLQCQSCHAGYAEKHPENTAKSLAEYKLSQEGVCAQCHGTVAGTYMTSVHGQSRQAGNYQDLPGCVECHGAHAVQPAATASFRAESIALCSSCHADKELMSRYGVSTDVVSTYLSDFHGRTSLLQVKQGEPAEIKEAVCTDCHGVHDIMKPDAANSSVMKENLLATCQKCHPDATANFPTAWMSHYQPTVTKTPLVIIARGFYWVMIPFTIFGLMVHIGFDVWRRTKNRRNGHN